MNDVESEVNLNKINPNVTNTFVVYRHRTIVDKSIDLPATKENFEAISTVLDRTKSEYFNLSEPKHE
jgi:protocatechuate 3,4-dioxygenase, beta subunit